MLTPALCSVIDFGAVERPIAVDSETRVTAQHQGCVEMTRQAPGDFRRSRIPADVIRQLGGLEAEISPERPWYAI